MEVYSSRLTLVILGNIITGCFLLAPTPTVTQIIKNKSVGEVTPIPYLATLGNCMVWFVYGLPLVHPYGTPILIINGIGVAIMTMYLVAYSRYCNTKQRLMIIVVVIVEVIFVVALATLTLTLIDWRGLRRFVIGDARCVCYIIMYIAPISVLMKVVKAKSVEHMSFLVAFAMLANAIVWSIISYLPLDPIMFITFGLCTLLGLVQVVVYAVYYRSTQRLIAARQTQSVIAV